MTPNQQAQKDRARAEAEHHLEHSAVDRMREKRMMEGERDANNAYAGED